tara:strand:+ start:125 stop:1321 length:1197 start_codon:yes stop_codon:yes gene_type:complete
MSIIYNILIQLYALLIRIHSLGNSKSRKWVEARKNIFTELQESIKNEKKIFWFHCASLGEYQQAKHLIASIKKQDASIKILLSFFSPSGYEAVKNHSEAHFECYLPIDTLSNAKKFLSIVKPSKAFFIKSEFWFNYMNTLHEKNIPLYHVSSVFKKDNIFLKINFFKRILSKSTHFFVQDNISFQLLRDVNIKKATVVGDTRLDSIFSDLKTYKKDSKLLNFSTTKPTIIFGSVWPEDEHIYLSFINKNKDYNYIIAPHEKKYSKKIANKTNSILYSEFIQKDSIKENVLIIDNIGILKYLYSYCKAAYIGGGFGKGIHNISEAAACMIPVLFGPNHIKFVEASELIKLKLAKEISTFNEFRDAVNSFIPNYKKDTAINHFKNQESAVSIIMKLIYKN